MSAARANHLSLRNLVFLRARKIVRERCWDHEHH
jgi:hypothetical protein